MPAKPAAGAISRDGSAVAVPTSGGLGVSAGRWGTAAPNAAWGRGGGGRWRCPSGLGMPRQGGDIASLDNPGAATQSLRGEAAVADQLADGRLADAEDCCRLSGAEAPRRVVSGVGSTPVLADGDRHVGNDVGPPDDPAATELGSAQATAGGQLIDRRAIHAQALSRFRGSEQTVGHVRSCFRGGACQRPETPGLSRRLRWSSVAIPHHGWGQSPPAPRLLPGKEAATWTRETSLCADATSLDAAQRRTVLAPLACRGLSCTTSSLTGRRPAWRRGRGSVRTATVRSGDLTPSTSRATKQSGSAPCPG